MVTVSRRALFPFLAPILVPAVFPAPAPYSIQTSESPSFLPNTIQPAERLFQSVAWLDNCENMLTKYWTKIYPACDFSPHAQGSERKPYREGGRT